jgi:hypothetical protein
LHIFQRYIYHTKFQDLTLSKPSVPPTSEVHGHHAGITDGRRFKITKAVCGLVAWCSYKVHENTFGSKVTGGEDQT